MTHFESPKLKQGNFEFGLKLFFASLILIAFSPGSVMAQTPDVEPEIVTVVGETQCGGQESPQTLEVWNVGTQGGEAYAEATFSGYDCINGKLGSTLKTMYGTFTGGPNGVAAFQICADVDDPNNCLTLNFQFVDGKQILYEGAVTGYVIQNPEAFGVDGTKTGPDCTADIHYDPALKPGDVLSPWSTYTAVPGGQEVIPIGEAYFINGLQTPSVIWDGQETTIELQYTCPGHQGYIAMLIIPAAGNPTFTPTTTVTLTPVGTGTSTPEMTDTPDPTDTSTPETTATFTTTPTKKSCEPLTADEKLTQVLNRYFSLIPKGITNSGFENNLLTLWDDQYYEFVCGGYQGKVLHLLDEIKFDDDPCVRAWLDDWDYGPIEAFGGGHQAVVIYPRGTIWTDTGKVLDPWITQTPQVYTIKFWSEYMSAGTLVGIQGSRVYKDTKAQYPTVDGKYTPVSDLNLSAEEIDFIRTLPADKQEYIMEKISPGSRKAWLAKMMHRQVQNATLSVNSPLDVYLTDDTTGRSSGIINGSLVNDLPEVSFSRFLRTDGHYWTQVEYPANRNFRVVMVGTGEGQARVFNTMTKDSIAGVVYQYDFAVSSSEFYQSETGEIGAAVVSSQARIEPDVISTADLAWIESQPGLVEPERFTQDVPPPKNLIIFILCITGLGLVAFLILLVGLIWFIRQNQKA